MSARSRVEASVRACYSTWGRSYYRDYYGAQAGYPPVHRKLVQRLLREAKVRTLLDAGCGPASMLRDLARGGLDPYGFDLTREMVTEARRVLTRRGVPPEHVWEGSVLAPRSYRPPGGLPKHFDAAICVGVLPHIPAGALPVVFRNLRGSVRPGGLVVVEARNQLFGLFTQNRYSYEFIVEELIRADDLKHRAGREARKLARLLTAFRRHFRMDLPPVRKGKSGEPGYDEVLSRTDNPFVLRQQFERAGFRDTRVLFYHYHCLPPMLGAELPALSRRRSLAIEDPHDWRGHFMASAFLLSGVRG